MIRKKYIFFLVGIFFAWILQSCSDDHTSINSSIPVIEGSNSENLALRGTATASSADQGRSPSFLIDGQIKQNENQGYYSSVGTGVNHTEWVQIALPEQTEINEVWVYPRYDGTHEGFPVDFTIQVSTDGINWQVVSTQTGNKNITDALPRKCVFPNIGAKYVKLVATNLYTTNNEWTGYTDTYILQLGEIEIYKREQSTLSVKLDSYTSVSGMANNLKVDVLTEQTADGSSITVELVNASDGKELDEPVKQEGTVIGNKAELNLPIPSSVKEGIYKIKVEVKGQSYISRAFSDDYNISMSQGKTYYVSSSQGDDNNDGLTEQKPLKTLTKVSQEDLGPNSKILLKAGDIWENQALLLKGSGTKEQPILISSYGSGARPIISPGYGTNTIYGIRIENGSGYEIKGVEVKDCYGGIVFWYENTYNNKYILIDNCYIHDVTGTTTNWGDGWSTVMPKDLVLASGICINGADKYGNSRICEDITIQNTNIDRCDVGIQIISRDFDPIGLWNYHGKDLTTPNNFNAVNILNCNITKSYRTGGVTLSCVSDVHAKNIVIDQTGYQGVGMYWGVAAFQVARVSNSLIEDCTFSNTLKGSSPDGQGFDFEADNDNVTVRKCKFLNNGGSAVLCYGDSWPGINTNNVVDSCYMEGNNIEDDNRIFNIGKPANSGMVKHCEIHMSNKATNFYSYPLVFDESNKVYDSSGTLVYNGGPKRLNTLFNDSFTGDLSKWTNKESAQIISNGNLYINNGQSIYVSKGTSWQDYYVEVKISGTSETASGGLLFRVDGSGGNYYVAKVNLRINYRSSIDLYKVTDGMENSSPVATFPCYSMIGNTAYQVGLEVIGNKVNVYMDGNLMGSYTGLAYLTGSTGLSNGASGTVVFDDFNVYKL